MRTMTSSKFDLVSICLKNRTGVFETLSGKRFTEQDFKYIDFRKGIQVVLSDSEFTVLTYSNGHLVSMEAPESLREETNGAVGYATLIASVMS